MRDSGKGSISDGRDAVQFGQKESLVVAAIWTAVRLLHSVNGRWTIDDVRHVVDQCEHWIAKSQVAKKQAKK